MKKTVTVLVVIAIVIIVFLILGPFYVVPEGEQAVVVRFGEIVSSTTEPGLKLKTPFVDQVVRYPARIMSWDGESRRFPTQEQQFIYVDTTARWRIDDPERFYARITTIQQAYARLDQFIEAEVGRIIAQNPIYEAVRSTNLINEIDRQQIPVGAEDADVQNTDQFADLIITVEEQEQIRQGRAQLSDDMLTEARRAAGDSGIELIDLVIRQIRYSDELTESVYDRMVSERQRIASAYRSLGQGRQEEILGQLQREKARILSEAYATSEQIRGEADASAAEIYSSAYQQDPQFFEFWRAIESYRQTLPSFSKTLTTDMEYFDYLYSESGR